MGFSGLGDGFSGLGLGFVAESLLLGSLLLGGVLVVLGEGLCSALAEVEAEEEASKRDFRWWEWAEKEE